MDLSKFEAALDERDAFIKSRIDAIEKLHARREATGGPSRSDAGSCHYRSDAALDRAFRKFLSEGNDAELKGMAVLPDPSGGYLVYPEFDREIIRIRDAISPVSRLCRNVEISTGSQFEIPIMKGHMAAAWVAEEGARDVTANPNVGVARIEKHEHYAMPEVTQRLLDDSQYPIDSIVVDAVGHGLARNEADALHNGNGVGKPRGFLTHTMSASGDSTRTWGELQYVPTGALGAWHTTKTDPLFDCIFALKAEYRARAVWVLNSATLASLSKLKEGTTDRPLWQPDLSMGTPGRLCGYPVVVSENMPAIGNNSLSLAFGDFTEAMTIIRGPGIRMLRDPYSVKGKVRFYAYSRVGANVVNFDALKLIRFSAT